MLYDVNMCGIAGISIRSDIEIDVELATLALLAGLAERGEDAAGYAFVADHQVGIRKRTGPVEPLLQAAELPAHARQVIVHLRDHTKGVPQLEANNHPIHHGSVIGVHNGRIQNDDALFAEFNADRAQPGMTVDSEAIFMLLDQLHDPTIALPLLVGSYACAWFDQRHLELTRIARGQGRPLLLGHAEGMVLFASTHGALQLASECINTPLHIEEVTERTLLTLHDGKILLRDTFEVHPFTEGHVWEYDVDAPNALRARAWVRAEHARRIKRHLAQVEV